MVVAVPALLVTGIVRTVNHHKVQQVLDQKAISFPLNMDDPDRRWSLIYPATPAPQTLAIEYHLHDQPHVLMIDLTQALPGLHLKSPSI